VSAKVPVAARRPPTAAVCFLGSVRHVESRFRHFPHVPRAPLRVSGMRDGYRVSALSQCGIVKERLFTFYDQVCEEGGPNAGRKHDQGNRRRWLSGCPKISKTSRDTAGCRPGVGCLHFRRPDCSLDPPPPPPPPHLCHPQVHTTGMDIPQAFDAVAALTLGKDMTFRDYSQAQVPPARRALIPRTIPPEVVVRPEFAHAKDRGLGERTDANPQPHCFGRTSPGGMGGRSSPARPYRLWLSSPMRPGHGVRSVWSIPRRIGALDTQTTRVLQPHSQDSRSFASLLTATCRPEAHRHSK